MPLPSAAPGKSAARVNPLTTRESLRFAYTPSPTCEQFMTRNAFINLIYGPRGEGKTSCGLMATVYHALQTPREQWPLGWALVRDTRRNIGITTARTVLEWAPKPHSVWRGKPDEPESITIHIDNTPAITFDCFGVDSPADLNRFQSYEASGGIWIEEPAPAATNAETLSSGIAETVLAVAITSARGSRHPRLQITMNPPSADHWTAQLFHLEGWEEADNVELTMSPEQVAAREEIRRLSAIYRIPKGENTALDQKTPGYRERNRLALLATGRTDLYARLVEGRVGYASLGEAVTPGFGPQHLAPNLSATINPQRVVFFSYDYGLIPAVICAQFSPHGNLNIFAAFVMENAGIEQLVTRYLRPWIAQTGVRHWVHIGGHEGTEREQSNSEENAVRTLIKLLGGRYIPGPVSWSARRDALHEGLSRYVGTTPWVQIDAQTAPLLVRCLSGGWHYPTDALGHVSHDLPSKRGTMPSIGDAFAHLLAVLLRRADRSQTMDPFGRAEKRGPSPTNPHAARVGAPQGRVISRTGA